MEILDHIVAIITIAGGISAAFNYVVIRPLQKAIDINSDVLSRLQRELEASAAESSESYDSSDAALSVAVDYCVDCTCCV